MGPQRPALSPFAFECSSWEAGSFSLLACKASIPSYVWWYKCSGHKRRLICLWLPPEGSLAPQNLVFEVRSGAQPYPHLTSPAPRTVAALPGVGFTSKDLDSRRPQLFKAFT